MQTRSQTQQRRKEYADNLKNRKRKSVENSQSLIRNTEFNEEIRALSIIDLSTDIIDINSPQSNSINNLTGPQQHLNMEELQQDILQLREQLQQLTTNLNTDSIVQKVAEQLQNNQNSDNATSTNDQINNQVSVTNNQPKTTQSILKLSTDITGFKIPEDITELPEIVSKWSKYIDKQIPATDQEKHLLATGILRKSKYADLLEEYEGNSVSKLIELLEDRSRLGFLKTLTSPIKQEPLKAYKAVELIEPRATITEKLRQITSTHIPESEAQFILRACRTDEQVKQHLKEYQERLEEEKRQEKFDKLKQESKKILLQSETAETAQVSKVVDDTKWNQLIQIITELAKGKQEQTTDLTDCVYHAKYGNRANSCTGPECKSYKPKLFIRQGNKYIYKYQSNQQRNQFSYQNQQAYQNRRTYPQANQMQFNQLTNSNQPIVEQPRVNAHFDQSDLAQLQTKLRLLEEKLEAKSKIINANTQVISKSESKPDIDKEARYRELRKVNGTNKKERDEFRITAETNKIVQIYQSTEALVQSSRINLQAKIDKQFKLLTKFKNLEKGEMLSCSLNTLPSNHNLMHLINEMNGERYLVDNGSQFSILPRRFLSNQRIRDLNNLKLTGAGGSPIKVHGMIDHTIKLRDKEYKHGFVIADTEEPIIGIDFMRKVRMMIDPLGNQIKLNNKLIRCCEINNQQSESRILEELIQENRQLFEAFDKPNDNIQIEHHINTVNDDTICSQPYYANPETAELIANHFQELEQKGFVQRSSSRFRSPVTVAKKSNGQNRYCIDYRKLNANTIPDQYPLPHIQAFNYRAEGSSVFSKIDLTDAYYNIRIRKEDIPKTAAATPIGLFEFTRMPFGLRTAPQTFQRVMDSLFGHLKYVFCYIDDILVFSKTLEEHVQHLANVFKIMQHAGLRINKRKSEFAKDELSFLSYRINKEGTTISNHHVNYFQELKPPRTIGQLRKIIGSLNYFSRFLPAYSLLTRPLTQIKSIAYLQLQERKKCKPQTEKTVADDQIISEPQMNQFTSENQTIYRNQTNEITTANQIHNEQQITAELLTVSKRSKQEINEELIVLNYEQTQAFEKLKLLVLEQIVLHHPKSNAVKVLETDASSNGYGAALFQLTDDNRKELIYLTSGVFSERINIRDTYENELTGAYLATRKLRKFLDGSNVVLCTDNINLVHKLNKPISDLPAREIRMLATIMKYVTHVQHIPGIRNGLADYLSRTIIQGSSNATKRQINFIRSRVQNLYLGCTLDLLKLLNEQFKDKFIQESLKQDKSTYQRMVSIRADQQAPAIFKASKDNRELLMVPESMIDQVILSYHNTFHPGYKATLRNVSTKFFFPHMRKRVQQLVKNCSECVRAKGNKRYGPRDHATKIIPLPIERFSTVHLDIVGPLILTAQQNSYILTIMDRFTRFLIMIPLKEQTAVSVIKAFTEHYVSTFGIPCQIITDNGGCFISNEFKSFTTTLKIQHTFTSSHHPQTNGLLERVHRTIKNSIRSLVN